MACEVCGGLGLVRTERGSAPCECQREAAATVRIGRIRLPAAFAGATLENFEPGPHTAQAHLLARRYVEEFLPANNGVTDKARPGVLFAGSVGTGKTHLAAGMARAIAERGFQPLFVDVRDLLDRLRRSYDNDARETQGQILGPIWAADLAVIDELGAQRSTDWGFETIELLIGGLYNRGIPTIVTTNLPNLAGGGTSSAARENEYQRAVRLETLGDRIGQRMYSRLQQMCRTVEMAGTDWRTRKRA